MKPTLTGARRLTVPVVALLAAVVLAGALVPAEAAVRLTPAQEKRLVNTFNRSQEKNLQYLPGMSAGAVSKVMAHRKAGHEFASAEEIRSVAGLTDEEFDALAGRFANLLSDKSATPEKKGKTEAGEKGNPLQERMKARSGKPGEGAGGERTGGPGPLNLEVKAKYYSILPGYDLSKLTDEQRHAFLETINTEMCPCGCQGETLGYCLVNDPGCMVVKARVRKIYKDLTGQDPVPPEEGSRR